MYKCLIIDDEKLARKLIENHIANIDHFEVIASCKSAIEASKVLNEHCIDLIFSDIEMPVLQGIDFYKNLVNKPAVIFTTAYRQYAVDGFEVNAIDYLLKPITFPRFFKAIEKFLATQNTNQTPTTTNTKTDKDYVFVTEDRKQVKLLFDTILYIESIKNYIKIITTSKTHVIKHGISSFENLLDTRFLRIHRSYIINTQKVTAFTKHDVEINTLEIPIGDSYKSLVFEVLK
ncbi:response regulator transcription factor [Tenacibaculum sp. 190524A02b]|uniref:LytR/AlgR family response regulator transcription factor n=1 Tax=Tenacibaculum vairaonense TaxID=3137860 RepID=UPI0031FA688E